MGKYWRQLEEEGYDLSLIEINLEASPRKRLEWADSATELALALRASNEPVPINEPDKHFRAANKA